MRVDRGELLRAAFELDPAVTVMRASGMQPAPWQAKLLRTRPHRGIVITSRQAGKSSSTAALALARAVERPRSLIVLVSPTQRQSTELLLKVAGYVDFLPFVEPSRRSAMTLELANGSRVLALPGTSGSTRGFSAASLIVADEAAWIADDVFTAVSPILAASGGDFLMLSTPAGRQGWLWGEWSSESGQWHRIEVPYTDVPHLDPEQVEFDRLTMGDRFRQEYECAFLSPGDAILDPNDIEAARRLPSDDLDDDLPDPRAILRNRRMVGGDAA